MGWAYKDIVFQELRAGAPGDHVADRPLFRGELGILDSAITFIAVTVDYSEIRQMKPLATLKPDPTKPWYLKFNKRSRW